MSVAAVRSIAVPSTVTTGASTPVADLASCEVQVVGTFSQTQVLQGSNDNSNWVDIATITSPGLTLVSKKWGWLRFNTTVHVSGSATAAVAGRKERSKLFAMEVKTTIAAGAALAVYELDPATRSLQVVPASAWTLSLEGSMDGSTWTTDQDVSAGGQFDVTNPWNYLRVNTTGTGTGTPEALIIGKRVPRFPAVRTLDTAVPVATPGAPTITNVGTAGSTAYSYKVVAKNAKGHSAASSAGSTSTGNATLTTSNYNHIVWTAVTGATGYDVYRTASSGTPSTTGLIASVDSATLFVDDKALTADGSTAPTVRTSTGLDVYVGDIESMKVVFQGAMTGGLDVEGSVDGTNYEKIGSTVTSAGVADISTHTLQRLRVSWSTYTSGTPLASVVGGLPLESVPS